MVSPFAAAKIAARRAVHSRAAVTVVYSDPDGNMTSSLTARWHDKLTAEVGDNLSEGYAQVFQGVDTLVFSTDELSLLSFPLTRGGTVVFPDYTEAFTLDSEYPLDGPINQKWGAVRTDYTAATAAQAALAAAIAQAGQGG